MEQGQDSTRREKRQQLSERERYKMEGYIEAGKSAAEIAELLKKSKRTIERERKPGMVEQKRMNPSFKKNESLYIVESVYKADAAQRRREERAANKGRGLKIGRDQELADYIEEKIKVEKWSPDAIIGRIKADGLKFKTSICTKTVYNYIDAGIFREVKTCG